MLIAARCVQAIGGAGAVCASLELMPSAVGSERRAAIDLGRVRRRSVPRSGLASAACSPS